MIKEMERITIQASKIVRALWLATAVLVAMSIVAQILVHGYGWSTFPGLSKLDVSQEQSLPTYFSALLFLTAGLLLGLISHHAHGSGSPFVIRWRVLSLLFLVLSIDEIISIHEGFSGPLRELLQTSGFLHYAWVIPGALFVLGLSIAYLPLIRALPRSTRRLFVLAAMLFVGGAIGVEMIGGYHASIHGEQTLTYNMISTVEETLEMAGQVVFVHALLLMIARNWPDSNLRIQP